MEKIISYPISVIYYLLFGLTLVSFHPIQWVCFNVLATRPIKECGLYEFPFVKFTALLGTSYKFENVERVPKNVPIIFVSNHQSMYDIIAMIWFYVDFIVNL
jgi:1-acyl-sn-glycerol-3-phosphate acyltransferase